jgi:ATP-dependent protease ClpP protease subunit
MKKQGVFLQAVATDATEAHIDIVGVIGWEVAFTELRGMFGALAETVKRVVFNIYSPGGDVWDGNGIIQAIGELGKARETEARVQVAASMATLIAVACQKRSIAANGRFLIHNAWTVTQGDADDHEKAAQTLRDCEAEAARFYAARTGQTEEAMRALMAEERWLTPTEAKELGFVQDINDPFDASEVAAVRAEIEAAGKWPVALVEIEATEGGSDAGTADDGTKGDASGAVDATDGAAMHAIGYGTGYAKGFDDGKAECEASVLARAQAAEDRLLAEVTEKKRVQAMLDAQIAESRKLQGERDQARASSEKIKAALDEATAKITRLLSGGLTFTPSVETWADALKQTGGDYEKARKQYPDVYRSQREQDERNRK